MYFKYHILSLFISIVLCSPENKEKTIVSVNKCCAEDETIVDNKCTHINETGSTEWKPLFTDESGNDNVHVNFKLVIGKLTNFYHQREKH